MFGRTGARAAARLSTAELYKQINPIPLRNWRAHQAEKLAPDAVGAKKALHHQHVHEWGPEYNKVTENNFPYPLMYGTCLFIWSACIFLGYTPSYRVPPNTNLNILTWNEKYADGTTKFPEQPETPVPFFADKVVIH